MRTNCRACNGTDLHSVLDLGALPLAGGFLANQNAIAREKLYPLEIHSCASCGLVQLLNPVDPEILFQDYSFSSRPSSRWSTISPRTPDGSRRISTLRVWWSSAAMMAYSWSH